MRAIEQIGGGELDSALARQICRLWDDTWPRGMEGGWEERAEGLRRDESEGATRRRFHLARTEDGLQAVCLSFGRRIRFVDDGVEREVMGLAGVCVERASRGSGLGAAVVMDAFGRLSSEGWPLSVFQTGVPGFYERLGAYVLSNRFVNSRSETDPEASPWWEPWVMGYGDRSAWRKGRVDLLGRGY